MKRVTKSEFIKMYESTTITAMAKHLGVAKATIIRWARKFNLQSKKRSLIK